MSSLSRGHTLLVCIVSAVFFKLNSCLLLISKWRSKDDIKRWMWNCTSVASLYTFTGGFWTCLHWEGNNRHSEHNFPFQLVTFCVLLISVKKPTELESPDSGPRCIFLEEHHATRQISSTCNSWGEAAFYHVAGKATLPEFQPVH